MPANPRAIPCSEPEPLDVTRWPEPARLRLEYAGRWVAWTEDGRRVVATGDDYASVRADAERAGVDRAILEWLPPLDEARTTGGA
jgi:hypothetical protein